MTFDNSLFAISMVSHCISWSWFSADCPNLLKTTIRLGQPDVSELRGAWEKPRITKQGFVCELRVGSGKSQGMEPAMSGPSSGNGQDPRAAFALSGANPREWWQGTQGDLVGSCAL